MNLDVRTAALESLALATRESLTDDTQRLYIERTDQFTDAVFVDACRRLEMSSRWFPKLSELAEQCRLVMKSNGTATRTTPDDFTPPSDEAAAAFLATIRERFLKRKRHA